MSPAAAVERYGTFQDSLAAPVHRWFAYPAGYSHRLVEAKAAEHRIGAGQVIADPFLGAGTTSVAAKMLGVCSVGTEAHPFVQWVADVKVGYDRHSPAALITAAERILGLARSLLAAGCAAEAQWPDLVGKCFTSEALDQLWALREAVRTAGGLEKDFFELALTAALRDATTAGAGWPYIAPLKPDSDTDNCGGRRAGAEPFAAFARRADAMIADVGEATSSLFPPSASEHRIICGDARELSAHTGQASVDMVLTSPPYLNNYDYADRTRLETYFWGMHQNWAEITASVRSQLITAATTQVARSGLEEAKEMPAVHAASGRLHARLRETVEQLTAERDRHSGRKSYDVVVAAYFDDLARTIAETARALKPGGPLIMVIGDSAPYGVHVATDEIAGEIAQACGFGPPRIEVLRTRGDKWAQNPQRHRTPLRESIVTAARL